MLRTYLVRLACSTKLPETHLLSNIIAKYISAAIKEGGIKAKSMSMGYVSSDRKEFGILVEGIEDHALICFMHNFILQLKTVPFDTGDTVTPFDVKYVEITNGMWDDLSYLLTVTHDDPKVE